MDNGKPVNARDLPIVKLMPRNKRKIDKKYDRRIEASIRAVGLIEPLVVYPVAVGEFLLAVTPYLDYFDNEDRRAWAQGMQGLGYI